MTVGLVRWDTAQNWYPGAVRRPGAGPEWAASGHPTLTWQIVLETDAPVGVVARWYQRRLRLATTHHAEVAGSCAFMVQARDLVWLSRAVTVLICATAPGTRVVITHRLSL